jgi:hypothetical protein
MWTEDELLALLDEARTSEAEEGNTAVEIAAVWGVCDQVARARIRSLLAAGRMRHVTVIRTQMNGVTKRISGYAPIDNSA